MFSSTDQIPLACSLLCTMFKVNFHPSSGFLLLRRFSTAMFLLSACCPRQSCPACSRHWDLLPKGNAFFCCRHALLVQGVFPLTMTAFRLGCSLFSVLCESSSARSPIAFTRPGLGVCRVFPFVLPGLARPPCSWFFAFTCGSITADECPPLREHQFVCLSVLCVY